MEEARWGFNWESMSEKCVEALVLAQREAEFLNAQQVGTEHVLIGLLTCRNLGAQVLGEHQVDVHIVRATLEKFRSRTPGSDVRRFSWRVRKAVELAFDEARRTQIPFVNTDHMYVGLLSQEDSTALRILADLGVHTETILQRLRREEPSGEGGPLVPDDFLAQLPVASHDVPELERITDQLPAERTVAGLTLDQFFEVLDELSKGLQTAQRMVESAIPAEAEAIPELQIPQPTRDEEWPVVDEDVYQISGLVRQILIGALLRRASRVSFEPSEGGLRIDYHTASGLRDSVEIPSILRTVVPFKVMRMARLNPMVKRQELEGRLTFRYKGQSYRMLVRSEPMLKGVRVEVVLV